MTTRLGFNIVFSESTVSPANAISAVICVLSIYPSLLTEEMIDPDKQVRLELWAYNPKEFSEDNSVDDISVVLSLGDMVDERVEEAVDELLERRLRD